MLASISVLAMHPQPAADVDRSGAPAGQPATLNSVLEGLRFVRRTEVLLGAILLDLLAVLFGGAVALLPIFARSILHVGATGLGVLRAAPAVGALLGAVFITRHPIERRAGRTLLIAVGLYGACIVVFGLSRTFVVSLLALGVSGFVDLYSMNIRSTTVALATPDRLRGRVNAVEMVFISASNQLGAFESGGGRLPGGDGPGRGRWRRDDDVDRGQLAADLPGAGRGRSARGPAGGARGRPRAARAGGLSMDRARRQLADELYVASREHDAAQADRLDRFRNVEPDTAQLLGVLIRAAGARRILELGTSNGYSTIWLADAAQATGGRVVSVDVDASRTELARGNLAAVGLDDRVELRVEDAASTLAGAPEAAWEFVFLDAERPAYPGYLPDLVRTLAPGGVLAIDNVESHGHELVEFTTLIEREPRLTQTVVPVGAGLRLAVLDSG